MQNYLTEQEIKNEIDRLAPFHHKVDLPYGLSTYLPSKSRRPIEYTRLSNLVNHAFPALIDEFGGSLEGKRVLDVACNCGGFSVEAQAVLCMGIRFDKNDNNSKQEVIDDRILNLHYNEQDDKWQAMETIGGS